MSEIERYGAQKADWDVLSAVCGLTEDLIPTVSNPELPISEASHMKQVGKTPSILNRHGKVTGFGNWTQYTADSADIEQWREVKDYGICIQTRKLRALDIDIDDAEQAMEVLNFIQAYLKQDVAYRWRKSASRLLVAFHITEIPEDEDLYKRTVKTEHGMIEFLATGQQFVAYGTHPSGARYEWANDGEFTEVPLHIFEELWKRLCKMFGTGEPTNSAARKRGEILAGVTDRIVEQLEEGGHILGWGKDGQAHIRCPFEEFHTTEGVVSSTSYFPAGTGGYANGHFVCLHAHCAERTDQEFMDALGIDVMPKGELAALSEDSPAYHAPKDPPFLRNDDGHIKSTANNIAMALEHAHICGYYIARDTFLEEIMLAEYDPETGARGKWRRLQDEDYFDIRRELESEHWFKPIAENNIRAALQSVARQNSFDSLHEYVNGLEWDGVPRIATFFEKYIPVSDKKFGRAVAYYLFTALAGRALQGGIKADMVPILIGEQGLMKTTAIEALAPIPDVFTELSLAMDDEKRVRLIKGKWIAEIGEMRGLWGSQIEDVKAFITKPYDHWVPKYKEQAVIYARRCVFIGTGNHHDILNDSTGTRRFLPLTVTEMIDVEAIRRDAAQLIAEGKVLFEQGGIRWQDAQKLSVENNQQYETVDPWKEMVSAWLNDKDTAGKTVMELKEGVSTGEILVCALGHSKGATNSGNGKRVGEIMRSLGFTRKRMQVGGRREYMWTAEDNT